MRADGVAAAVWKSRGGEYGATLAAARRRYRAYVHACVTEDDEPLLKAMRTSRHAIGEAGFIEESEQRLGELRTGRVLAGSIKEV